MRQLTLIHLLIGSLLFIFLYGASLNVRAHVEPQATPMQDARHQDVFPFENYEARYKVTWRGVDAGVSIHRLSKVSQNRYYFEAVTEPNLSFLPFKAFESSLFTWEKNEIKPYQFQYDINEGKKKRAANIQFNWNKNKIVSLNNADPFELELDQHFQDKLTHLFMVRRDLQKAKQPGQPITYTVATGDKTKTYTFEYVGTENLETKMGTVQAIKLKNITQKDRITTIWFAKEWQYLPAKIMHARGGKTITTAEITGLSG